MELGNPCKLPPPPPPRSTNGGGEVGLDCGSRVTCSGGVPSAGTLVSPAALLCSRPAARGRKKRRSAKARRPENESRHAALILNGELERGMAGRAVSGARILPHVVVTELARPVVSDVQPPLATASDSTQLIRAIKATPSRQIWNDEVRSGVPEMLCSEPVAFALAAHHARMRVSGPRCPSANSGQTRRDQLRIICQGAGLFVSAALAGRKFAPSNHPAHARQEKAGPHRVLFARLPRASPRPNPTVLESQPWEFHGRKLYIVFKSRF